MEIYLYENRWRACRKLEINPFAQKQKQGYKQQKTGNARCLSKIHQTSPYERSDYALTRAKLSTEWTSRPDNIRVPCLKRKSINIGYHKLWMLVGALSWWNQWLMMCWNTEFKSQVVSYQWHRRPAWCNKVSVDSWCRLGRAMLIIEPPVWSKWTEPSPCPPVKLASKAFLGTQDWRIKWKGKI